MLILVLSTMVLFLTVLAVAQIKMAGIEVKDFWSFIKANETLNNLYAFSVKYDKLSPQQQVLFLREADTIFDAFDKVPNALWEDEYEKYMKILDKYKDIKVKRWTEVTVSEFEKEKEEKEKAEAEAEESENNENQ